ncbi:hypothetical protein ACVXG7_10195 [Enterobacter hormaechei]
MKQNGTVHARFMLARASVRDIIGHPEMAGGLNGHRQEGSYANDSTPLPASSDRK